MVGYNNMFQNPGERDVGGSSRDQFLLLLAASCCFFTTTMYFIFCAHPLHLFFVPIFNDCCKGAHTRTKGLDTHTHKLHLLFFLSYLCLSSSLFFIDYIVYTRRDIIYTSFLVLPLLLPLLLVFRGSGTVSMTRMFKEAFSLFSERKKASLCIGRFQKQ